jgi:hypothetical protein
VVTVRDALGIVQEINRAQQIVGIDRVPAYPFPFFIVQRSGFKQDAIRHADLANVMQECPAP